MAGMVYRGLGGKGLPPRFWTKNKFGVAGGVETAFMSTSTDKEVALSYATSAWAPDSMGVIFEIQQGMVDRGYELCQRQAPPLC